MTQGGLRAVFLAERARFHRLLVARLGTDEQADEALQDLWLKLETANAGPIADPVSYLFRMANNIAVDRRRSATRRADRDADWLETRPAADEWPDAERTMIARDQLARVEATLERLPVRVATAFRLYRYEGLPQKAVAERMGISVSGVEKLLHRAYLRIHPHRSSFGGDPARAQRLKDEEDRSDGR